MKMKLAIASLIIGATLAPAIGFCGDDADLDRLACVGAARNREEEACQHEPERTHGSLRRDTTATTVKAGHGQSRRAVP